MYTMHDGGGGISTDDISIEQQRVNEILATLNDAQTKVLKGARLGRVPAQSFGMAATATELELHAGKGSGRAPSRAPSGAPVVASAQRAPAAARGRRTATT